MKILIIEKSEVCRFILEQCLTSLGHVFHHAGNVEEALPFMLSQQIEFVFIDMDFGRERVADAIKSIRTEHQGEWLPVVALSSGTDDEAFANAILAGADSLLPKPLSRNRILMQVIALERINITRQNPPINKDLIAANQALLKLSMYDEITGLANRRYFEKTLDREIRLTKRERRQLTLLMCEIGNITLLNEADEDESRKRYLNTIATAIECIPSRPTDFVCRYGGNSFAVILPNTNEEGAQHVAEKIQGSVELALAKCAFGWPKIPLTFRIGSATYDRPFQTIDEFIHAACAALKTCVEVH
jgi:diguanylate cyclase (GGDEF)-like protein